VVVQRILMMVDGSFAAETAARRHDLIFLGTKGPTGFARRLRARTVEHVVRSSPCDLMLFRPAAA
jgi:nucleotide-binding universal stress UspA family protein